jgi:hypothetical protein
MMRGNKGSLVVYGLILLVCLGGYISAVRGQALLRAQFPTVTSCNTDAYWEIMKLDSDIEKLYDQALVESHKAMMASVSNDGLDVVHDHAQMSLDFYEEVGLLTKKKVKLMRRLVNPESPPEQTVLRGDH